MQYILLVGLVLLMACQKLRLEVDDLRLRCGDDANLVDVSQWIEPFSDYGKPNAASVRASVIYQDLKKEKLPISSKGCIAVPANISGWEWLVIRSEQGGVFGKILKGTPERYRRVQMVPIAGVPPRFDCPSASALDELRLKLVFQDRTDREHLLLHMSLADSENSLIARLQQGLSQTTDDQFSFDLRQVKEGSYQAKISLIDLFNLQDNLKDFERLCTVRVDRSAPKVKLVLRSGGSGGSGGNLPGIRLSPGEAVEIKTEDTSPTRILSCWAEKQVGSCQNFVEAGARLSAPNEGEWIFEYYAIDEAGNTSEKLRHEVGIYDADRVGRIVGWIDEARLYLKQDSYFDAAKRLYQAAWAMANLKTQTERKYIQEKIRLPFLSLLVKNVPLNRFRSDDGNVLDLWGVSSTTFLVHIDGERRLGRMLKLHDLSGKLLSQRVFEDDAIIRFSWQSRKVLVWRPDGVIQLYNQDLSLATSYSLAKSGEAAILAFQGSHALLLQDDGLFHLDLTRPQVRLLDKVQDKNPSAALSYSGKWLVYQTEDGLVVQDLEKGSSYPKTFATSVEAIRFAGFVDTMCVKLTSEIKCGKPEKILQNEYILQGNDAVGDFAIEANAKAIGYVGAKGVYQFDAIDGSFYLQPYLKRVFSLYYFKQFLMLESTDGALSWLGLPADAGEARPFDPELRPKISKNWADNGQIFFEDFIGAGNFHLSLRAFNQAPLEFYAPFRGTAFYLDKMTLLPDQSHLLVVDKESHINIYSTQKNLLKAYSVDCLFLDPLGKRCLFPKDGKMYYGEFVQPASSSYAKTDEMPGIRPYATAVWDPFNSDKLATFDGNNVSVFDFKSGNPRVIFQTDYSRGTWEVKWLTARYLAISDGYTEIEVWDVERNQRIFALTDRHNVESMFEIPMDYSPILDAFVVVAKDKDSSPVMEIWKTGKSEAEDSYKFTDEDMEYAQIVKFMADGKLLLVGFHHGYVYAIKDLSQSLRPGNIISMKEHQDIVYDLGFLKSGKIAYSISQDGSIITHKLEGDFTSEDVVKTDYINDGGWLESDEVFWVQHNNATVFYDVKGRVVERGDVALKFFGDMVVLETGAKALFNWKHFDVWQNLCLWSPQLAKKAMDDLEIEWKSCNSL